MEALDSFELFEPSFFLIFSYISHIVMLLTRFFSF